MKRTKQKLQERAKGSERLEEEPADQRDDGQEDEFDSEFWTKVSNVYDFLNNFWKNLNSEYG